MTSAIAGQRFASSVACGVSLAALKHVLADDFLSGRETAVLFSTASGCKYLEALQALDARRENNLDAQDRAALL